jgi:formylglycine-generating enzyme required for sulfatase activity
VLRGGSWLFNQDLARADFRYNGLHFLPLSRVVDLGFRVLCGAPIR